MKLEDFLTNFYADLAAGLVGGAAIYLVATSRERAWRARFARTIAAHGQYSEHRADHVEAWVLRAQRDGWVRAINPKDGDPDSISVHPGDRLLHHLWAPEHLKPAKLPVWVRAWLFPMRPLPALERRTEAGSPPSS